MRTLVIGRSNIIKKSGFTLIELVVVLFILAIVSMMVLLGIGSNKQTQSREIVEEIEALVNLAVDQSIMRQQTLGIVFHSTGFNFVKLDQQANKWLFLKGDKLLKQRDLPSGLYFQLDIKHDIQPLQIIEQSEQIPQVIITSAGQISTFTLTIKGEHEDYEQLQFQANGLLVGSKVE